MGHLNHPMMTEKLRHSGERLDNASQSRERQDKQKGLAKLLEPGNNIPAGWARAGGWHPFILSQSCSGPALPSRRFICHPGDRWPSGGCRSGDVTLREPRSSLPADKGEAVNTCVRSPTTTGLPASHPCAAGRGTKGCCEHRYRCTGARAGCRWGSWVLIGNRENRA